jgi:SAM-dependent methyltransferase
MHFAALAGGTLLLCCLAAPSAQTPSAAIYLSHEDALPVFAALGEPAPAKSEWSRWIAAADEATRARVAQGDETSVVNLLLFGTSFTRQPRITARQITQDRIRNAVSARLDDFERALAQPGSNERLQYARRLLPGGEGLRARLLSMIDRTMKEGEALARLTVEAERLGDPSLQFAERSRLYRDRGLASDTSIRVNFAIEEALRGAYPKGAPRLERVGIVGPGLDVVDKEEGYDFYPPQTLQPFSIIDSLVRLGLADANAVRVTTFDVSARVNDHIAGMVRPARTGAPYLLHLSLDGEIAWTPALLSYFAGFGGSIGSPVPVTVPTGVGRLRLRALAVRPSIVGRIAARDLNVTAQVLPLENADRFDLIVGTNIFVYYDRVQQGLAMAGIARMLRPGGLLLSNNALVEVPSVGMQSIGYSKTLYSNRPEDGDLIIRYQKVMK